MKRRAVSFVPGKCVLGKLRVMFDHQPIARHLSDHARGSDTKTESISADERSLGDRKRANRKPVDEHMIRRDGQSGGGAAHRFMRRAQNVQTVDFIRTDDRDPKANLPVGHDFGMKAIAGTRGKFLRIREQLVRKIARQDHRCGDHRSGQRTATRFVDPSDP